VSVLERVERLCNAGLAERWLRLEVLAVLRDTVGFDAYAWLLTDPETAVGASPLAEVPSLDELPDLIRLKYATAVNRWTSLPSGPAASLAEATGGRRADSPLWAERLSAHGVEDVLSAVSRDRLGCWAFLDLWRIGGSFRASDRDLVGRVCDLLPAGLRRALVDSFVVEGPGGGDHGAEPAVVILTERLQPVGRTPRADDALRALLPPEPGRPPVPAAAFNVAAQLLANEARVDDRPPWARAHVPGRGWTTFRAARLADAAPGGPAIAVSIEPTPPAERLDLYARVIGLTVREAELLRALASGSSTRELAARLFVSEHTVQDHLKAMFAKAGVSSRRLLVARATGSA
jgi:DNA-binding CsgD family transcriptional regulator